ncbi:hypothetical protein CYMTET_33865, partial [Cymbomonas tetramitiformis]
AAGRSSKRGKSKPGAGKERRAEKPSIFQNGGRICAIAAGAGGHTASASHLTIPAFSSGRHVLSGGNDGCLLLWDWLASAESIGEDLSSAEEREASDARQALVGQPFVERIEHGEKVRGHSRFCARL